MDLGAHILQTNEQIAKYIDKNYGEIPRPRGIRFMKIQNKIETEGSYEFEVFNKYVGQDVIYIHTRCGDCGMGYEDENSNYIYCGAKEWEEKNKELFLEHVTEEFDSTYCTHYFKAVVDDEYKQIIDLLK